MTKKELEELEHILQGFILEAHKIADLSNQDPGEHSHLVKRAKAEGIMFCYRALLVYLERFEPHAKKNK